MNQILRPQRPYLKSGSSIVRKVFVPICYLFGSYARGDMTINSDIDLRIDKGRIRGLEFAGLLGDLEDALGANVDLISTAGMDPSFLKKFRRMRFCCMQAPNRDLRILTHIISYCDQIHMAVEPFGDSYETFSANPVYRNAVSLCILQIGELVGNLSEEFKTENPSIPWRQIKLMRSIVAHRYETVDHALT